MSVAAQNQQWLAGFKVWLLTLIRDNAGGVSVYTVGSKWRQHSFTDVGGFAEA